MLTDVVIANKSYTKLNISDYDGVDEIALKVMRQDCPEFLLPIRVMEIDGEMEIRYELLEGVRLSYMPREMSKKDFVAMFTHMLLPFKNCNDWFLDYHCILLDENYILVGKNGQSVKFIYIPSAKYRNSDEAIKDFFTGIILKTDCKDDLGYMMNLLRMIKKPDSNLLTLLEYLQQEAASGVFEQNAQKTNSHVIQVAEEKSPKKEVEPVKNLMEADIWKPKTGLLAKKKEPEEKIAEHEAARPGRGSSVFGKQDEEGILIESLFGESSEPEKNKDEKKQKEKVPKSGGLFGLFKGKKKEEKTPEEKMQKTIAAMPKKEAEEYPTETAVADNRRVMPEADDETSIPEVHDTNDNTVLRLRLDNCIGCSCPQFIEIPLQKGFATVGRMDKNGEPHADFNFDSAVSFVSRRQFRVEKKMEEWQIIDLESSNGTFVNGERLLSNIPYPLTVNDSIMIVCNKRRLVYRVC